MRCSAKALLHLFGCSWVADISQQAPTCHMLLACVRMIPDAFPHGRYRFHLELPNGGYQFLLSARKRVKTATSSYIISTSADDVSRHSNSYIAKLRSNFVGTGFSMYLTGGASGSGSSSAASSRPMSGALGSGVGGSRNTNTQRQLVSSSTTTAGPLQAGQRSMRQQHSGGGGGGIGSSSGRRSTEEAWQAAAGGAGGGVGGAGATNKQEFGAVMYEYNVLGTRGPRKLSAAVPHVDDGGNVLWVPSGPQDSMAERLRYCFCGAMFVSSRAHWLCWTRSYCVLALTSVCICLPACSLYIYPLSTTGLVARRPTTWWC